MSKIKSQLWDGKSSARYITAKIDGMFLRVHKSAEGIIRCTSSIGTDLTYQIENCKPRWLVNLHKNMPNNSTILGELYYYDIENKCGCPASYIKTGLAEGMNWFNTNLPIIDKRILRSKSLEKIGTKQLRFAAFAVESGFDSDNANGGNNISASSSIEDINLILIRLGVERVPFINIRNKFGQDFKLTRDFLLDGVLQDFAANCKGSIEGCMLKDSNLLGWKKVKKENTIDLIILDYLPGKGKYRGKIGSLVCGLYNNNKDLIRIAAVGGFNDAIRDWITNCFFERNGLTKKHIVNQVIEATYQLVGSKGGLRHIRMKNWRDDKVAEECLTSQHPDLEKYWG